MADALINHVAEMITRVEQGDNPEVPIQSPTLSILFEQGNSIETEIEIVENGVIVTQTSDIGDLVAALQKHAGEVSDLASRGMVAVHGQMMKTHHGGQTNKKLHLMIAQPELRNASYVGTTKQKYICRTFS